MRELHEIEEDAKKARQASAILHSQPHTFNNQSWTNHITRWRSVRRGIVVAAGWLRMHATRTEVCRIDDDTYRKAGEKRV